MNFALNTILVFIFLLPGFFFFRGINSVSFAYISQGLLSWKGPNIISTTLFVSLFVHGLAFILTIIFLLLFFDFNKQNLSIMGMNDVLLYKLLSSIIWLIFYIYTISVFSYLLGVLFAKRELISKKAVLQIYKHEWILKILKGVIAAKNIPKHPFPYVCVYTTEIVTNKFKGDGFESEITGKVKYRGSIEDFFISNDGRFEYIVLNGAEKSTSLFDNEPEIGGDDEESSWIPVSDEEFESNLYIEGEKILNFLIQPPGYQLQKKQNNVSEQSKNDSSEELDKIEQNLLSTFSWSDNNKNLFLLFILMVIFLSLFGYKFLSSLEKARCAKRVDSLGTRNTYNFFVSKNNSKKNEIDVKGKFKTNASFINVRSKPSRYAKIITNLNAIGENILVKKVLPENDSWYEVTLPDGRIGYIFSDLLSEKQE